MQLYQKAIIYVVFWPLNAVFTPSFQLLIQDSVVFVLKKEKIHSFLWCQSSAGI